jgi:hypothetical protein
MFKSKHSGWTWDLKRTPFGGGGGDIFQSVGNALASIDPGPAIGKGLSEVDTFVNREVPGGWTLPAIIAAAYLTGGGSLAAEGALEGGTMAAGAEGGTVGSLGAGGSFVPAAEGASFTVTPGAAYTAAGTSAGATAAGEAAYNAALENGLSQIEATNAANQAASAYANIPLETSTPGANSVLAQPDVAVNLGATNGGTVGSLNPALPAAGAPNGTSVGMSAALPPGTVMGTGLPGGGAIGVTYAAGANGMPATDFFGNYIPASSINTGGVPSTITGTTATTTNSDLLKLLKQGAGSGLSKSLGQLAQGANAFGQDLPGIVRGNQNPFAQSQYFQVSNKKPDLSALAELLKQG